MSLPAEYSWLLDPKLRPLPKVVQVGLRHLGIQEVVGKGSHDAILGWRDQLNAAGHKIVGFSDDDIPWCGLYIAYLMFMAGKPVQKDPLWARNWANYGTSVAALKNGKLVNAPGLVPSLGDILVYQRPGGGGHVDIYIAETPTAFVGLGGNKSNRVQISGIEKSRCIAVRRPPMNAVPVSVRPFFVSRAGNLTRNEA